MMSTKSCRASQQRTRKGVIGLGAIEFAPKVDFRCMGVVSIVVETTIGLEKGQYGRTRGSNSNANSATTVDFLTLPPIKIPCEKRLLIFYFDISPRKFPTITKGDTSLYTFGKSHSSSSVEHNQRFPSHEISTKCDPALKFEPCEKHPKIKYKIIYNKVELPKSTCDPTKVRNFLIGNTKNCQFIFANSRVC